MDRNSPTADLETRVAQLWGTNPYPSLDQFSSRFIRLFVPHCRSRGKLPAQPIVIRIMSVAEQMYEAEGRWDIQFATGFTSADPIERGKYRDALLRLITLGEVDAEAWFQTFIERLFLIFDQFIKALPSAALVDKLVDAEYIEDAPPVLQFMQEVGEVVNAVIVHTFIDYPEHHSIAFNALKRHLTECGERVQGKGEPVMADEYKGSPREIVNRFLGEDSMLAALFYVPMPMLPKEPEEEPELGAPTIADRTWFQHCLLLAQTGAGKTNAIRWRIAQLLPQVAAGRASLIVMEPKGDLIDELLHFAALWPLRDRVVILDPADASVSVNLFEPPTDSSPVALNETIDRVSRVLNTITLDMTALQKQALTLAMRAMYAMGNPSMRSLMTILRRGKAALSLDTLPLPIANFFEDDFREIDGRLIIQRLNGLLSNPIFEALFAGEHTTFDMLDAINDGKLLIINSGRAPEIYGRFWIEELDRCIRPRMAMPESQRTPTYFILDEAAVYVADDPHFARMLDMARGARIGLLVAAQHLEQDFTARVRNSLLTNTALKFVARTSGDIFNLCRSMGTTEASFLGTVPAYHFAFFGPNMTEARLVKLPLVEFLQQMTAAQYGDLRRLNRQRYATHTPPSDPTTSEKVAFLSPRAAALDARQKLEEAVRTAILGLALPEYAPGMTMVLMIRLLEERQVIDRDTRNLLHKLRLFGNDAQHNTDTTDLTKGAALQFAQEVERVVNSLQSQISQHLLRKSPPRREDESNFDTDWKER